MERGRKMQTTDEMLLTRPGNLSARTLKVRDAVIEKCKDLSLEEMNKFIKQLLDQETNEQKRLGLFAARVYLLRQRISSLFGLSPNLYGEDAAVASPSKAGKTSINAAEDSGNASAETAEAAANKPQDWTRVRILEDSEVNQVRFPAGVIIDALASDAEKLIEMGKAERVSSDDASADDASKGGKDKEKSDAVAEEASADTSIADDAGADDPSVDAKPEDTDNSEKKDDAN